MTEKILTFGELISKNALILTDDRCKVGAYRMGLDPCPVWEQSKNRFAFRPLKTEKGTLCQMADAAVASLTGEPDWKNADRFHRDPVCGCYNFGGSSVRFTVYDNIDLSSDQVCTDCERAIGVANSNPEKRFTFNQQGGKFDTGCKVRDGVDERSLGRCKNLLSDRQYREVFLNED